MLADEVLTLIAPEHAGGTRLDQFLRDPLGSRSRAERLIDAGRVTVNGQLRRKRHVLSGGEQVVVDARERSEAEVQRPAIALEIPYEDEHLLVVDKQAGIVVHPARGHRSGTLAQALSGRVAGGEEPWRAGIVHRLDRDTSGLLVVAKSDAVHRALKKLLAARLLRREYLTLVEGAPSSRTGTVDAPIGRDRRDRVRMSIDSEDAREARTHFEVLETLPASSLLRVTLETGRTHQIRVHLAAIGHPVVGDPQYGRGERYGLVRQFLHAARLRFEHPVSGAVLDVSSELPADLNAALVRAELAPARRPPDK